MQSSIIKNRTVHLMYQVFYKKQSNENEINKMVV